MNRLLHLARRLVGVVRSRPLSPLEQARVAALLCPGERQLFWRQSPVDQRHAHDCALRVTALDAGRRDLARAALLHDVGKGLAPLPVPGRVVAGFLSLLHLPAPGRLGSYLAHGPHGAEALRAAGAETLVVAYARHHHGARPAEIPPRDWDLLARADQL